MNSLEKFLEDYYKSENHLLDDTLLTEVSSVFDEINLEKQIKKLSSRMSPSEVNKTIEQDRNRFILLVSLANHYNLKNVFEVGTADGCQAFSFVKYFQHINAGHIWTCDIENTINKSFYNREEVKQKCIFIKSDSSIATNSVSEKVDLFFIDGDHRRGAVVSDIKNLKKNTRVTIAFGFSMITIKDSGVMRKFTTLKTMKNSINLKELN
jgi:predicted O-methyltransferase YrrM